MDTVLKADIFFFVTTIAVVAFSILGGIAFLYLIKILRNIKKATDKLEGEIEAIGENADALYHKIAESFVFNMLFGKRKNK
jgi:uncharacterized protein YoxC